MYRTECMDRLDRAVLLIQLLLRRRHRKVDSVLTLHGPMASGPHTVHSREGLLVEVLEAGISE